MHYSSFIKLLKLLPLIYQQIITLSVKHPVLLYVLKCFGLLGRISNYCFLLLL